MRLPRAVATATMIVAFALVAAPGTVGSRVPTLEPPMDPARFSEAVVPPAGNVAMTHFAPAEMNESDGRLDGAGLLVERELALDLIVDMSKPEIIQPEAPVRVVVVPVWLVSMASFYGPGFYNKRTACGLALTKQLVGVAHRTLPCGTRITFRNRSNGRVATMPVVDRGPYVAGREWDLTGGACLVLNFCYTAKIAWKFAN